MPHYSYLIVGGGMTGAAAVNGVRAVDAQGAIGMISAEPNPPYNRPPLSKGLWKGKPLDAIWHKAAAEQATLHLGRRATRLDLKGKRVVDDQDTEYTFGKLLLATGGAPRRLPFGGDHIIYYRTLADYERLRRLADERQGFAVIGGGFIGSEIAAALAMNGKQVVMLCPEQGIGARQFPADLSRFITDYYRQKGVEVLTGELAEGLQEQGDKLVLQTRGGGRREVDGVVAGVGIQPDVELAQAAGLTVEDGIVVDEHLRTSHPDVFAAGDVASFHNPALGRRMRVEHEDNANTMGEAAGRSMAGADVRYDHLPYFYSDLFELGYEAVGELSSELETVADWQDPFRKGVVYYLRGGRVRGALLWDVWGQVDAARKLIAEPGPFKSSDLEGRITG